VKNTLTTVQAIAAQTFRSGGVDAAVRETFEARLFALAKVHDTLTRENWEGADLEQIVLDAIAPYRGEGRRFQVEGPPLRLRPGTALAFAIALQELCTNATKYGSLSNGAGRVEILWRVSDPLSVERRLQFLWTERDGPPVSPPTRAGFGTRLIQHGLARELGGRVDVTYGGAGLVCAIEAPLPSGDPTPVVA
jgi:two-component sensor histidine kinase